MRWNRSGIALAGLTIFATFQMATAQAGAYGRCGACAYEWVEKTIYVPAHFVETRTVRMVRYKHELRERTVHVRRCVPDTSSHVREYTVQVPQIRTRTHTYQVNVPVWREVDQKYTVLVPHHETRHGERTVCRPVVKEVEQHYTVLVPHTEVRHGERTICKYVPVTKTRYVCRDLGHWSLVQCCHPGCGSCCHVRKIWVPNIVKEPVEFTCHKPVLVKVPYDYNVTVCEREARTCTVKVCSVEYVKQPYEYSVVVCEPQERTRTVKVCDYETQERSCEVNYVVCVPEKRQCTYNVTTYKTIVETKTVHYKVCVPYTVEKEIQVRVCRMVPKKVMVQRRICVHCGY